MPLLTISLSWVLIFRCWYRRATGRRENDWKMNWLTSCLTPFLPRRRAIYIGEAASPRPITRRQARLTTLTRPSHDVARQANSAVRLTWTATSQRGHGRTSPPSAQPTHRPTLDKNAIPPGQLEQPDHRSGRSFQTNATMTTNATAAMSIQEPTSSLNIIGKIPEFADLEEKLTEYPTVGFPLARCLMRY